MFDAKLLPCVSSFTLFSKNGVVFAPFIPCYSAYLKACWIAFSISYPSAGLLFGTETRQPFLSPSLCFQNKTFAIYRVECNVHGDFIPELAEKKAGNHSLPYVMTGTP